MKKKIFSLFFGIAAACFLFAACAKPVDTIDGVTVISAFRWDLSALSTAQRNKTPLTEYFKNNLGVTFKVSTAPSSSWEDSFNVLVNTRRMPDMFVFYGPDRPVQYKRWVSDGLLLPISDYVSENKYPNIYRRLKEHDYLLNLDFTDGKHYALPVKAPKCDHTLYVRTDWIEAVNAKPKFTGEPDFTEDGARFHMTGPATMEEFYWLCKAFTEQDPDGNDKNDTYGFTTSDKNLWFINFAFYAFEEGAWNDRVYDSAAGKYTESWISKGSKEAVRFFNKLYSEKLMDTEFLTNTGDQKIEKFVTQKVGIMMHNAVSGYNYIEKKFVEINKHNKMTYFAPPAGTTGLSGQRGGLGVYSFTGINANVSEVKREKILKLLDFLMSNEGFLLTTYGIENVHYRIEGETIVNLIEPSKSGEPRNIRDADAGSLLKTFVDMGDDYIYPWDKNYEILTKLAAQTEANSRLFAPLQYYNGANILTKGQELNEFGTTTYGNLIMGKPGDFDRDWEAFVNSYLSSERGGSAVIDEYNEAVNRILGKQ